MSMIIRSSKDLGHALRRKRLKKSMTQSDVAKRNGTKQNAISRIESGDMGRTVSLFFKILGLLDLELVIRPRTTSSAEDIESLFP